MAKHVAEEDAEGTETLSRAITYKGKTYGPGPLPEDADPKTVKRLLKRDKELKRKHRVGELNANQRIDGSLTQMQHRVPQVADLTQRAPKSERRTSAQKLGRPLEDGDFDNEELEDDDSFESVRKEANPEPEGADPEETEEDDLPEDRITARARGESKKKRRRVEAEDEEDDDETDYAGMTKAELVEEAENRGIERADEMSKSELVKKLEEMGPEA